MSFLYFSKLYKYKGHIGRHGDLGTYLTLKTCVNS